MGHYTILELSLTNGPSIEDIILELFMASGPSIEDILQFFMASGPSIEDIPELSMASSIYQSLILGKLNSNLFILFLDLKNGCVLA